MVVERTVKQYKLLEYNSERTHGQYDMPMLEGIDHVPSKLMGFNYALSRPDKTAGVHFYLDDYQFERVWQRPYDYIARLSEFDCCLTPDFSLYTDMPVAMMVWNIYRSRLIGQICQDYGMTVIPTVSWADRRSFDFCFDGLPQNGTLSISTIGVKRSTLARKLWQTGVEEMLSRLTPRRLLVYGGRIDFDYGETQVHYYENEVTARLARYGR